MNDFAPIVLFTYKRLPILARVVDSLLRNNECQFSKLIVYSDGPKSKSDEASVKEVRAYLGTIKGFEEIEYFYRDTNFGLARSFITGITETLEKYEKAIFLEDDNLLSEHFLSFMNGALIRYSDDLNVFCITGYCFPIWPKKKRPYFIRSANTWSMATWRRGWKNFNEDAGALLREIHLKNLVGAFSGDGLGFYEMLHQQIEGKIDSWGVRFVASAFVKDMYCLYPNEPLCISIGYGEDSAHCKTHTPIHRLPENLSKFPITTFPKAVKQGFMITILLRVMSERIRWHSRIVRVFSLLKSGVK